MFGPFMFYCRVIQTKENLQLCSFLYSMYSFTRMLCTCMQHTVWFVLIYLFIYVFIYIWLPIQAGVGWVSPLLYCVAGKAAWEALGSQTKVKVKATLNLEACPITAQLWPACWTVSLANVQVYFGKLGLQLFWWIGWQLLPYIWLQFTSTKDENYAQVAQLTLPKNESGLNNYGWGNLNCCSRMHSSTPVYYSRKSHQVCKVPVFRHSKAGT